MTDPVRAFVGCLLDLGASRRVTECARAFRKSATQAGWQARFVPPPNLHITLRFLGELDPGLTAPVADAMRSVAAQSEPMKLLLGALAAFGEPAAPRVVYVDLRRGRELLSAAREALDARLAELGIEPENKPFAPHLTLARVREATTPLGSLGVVGVDGVQATVSELTLWRSDLTRPGAEHHVLARATLGQARAPAR